MEDKSELEKLNDNLTHILIKKIYEEYDDYIDLNGDFFDDYNLMSAIEEGAKLFINTKSGYHHVGIEDYNYVISLLKKNPNYDYSSKKPTGNIIRPEGHLYTFDVDEDKKEYVIRTFKVEVFSYDEKLVFDTFTYAEGEGVVSYYDYPESNVNYYDGETYEVKYNRKSLRKIK